MSRGEDIEATKDQLKIVLSLGYNLSSIPDVNLYFIAEWIGIIIVIRYNSIQFFYCQLRRPLLSSTII